MKIRTASVSKFRQLLARPWRSFRRNEDGATAIEFGILAVPFLAFLFAIIETALVFLRRPSARNSGLRFSAVDSDRSGAGRGSQPGDVQERRMRPDHRIARLPKRRLRRCSDVPELQKIVLPLRPMTKMGRMNNSTFQASNAGDIVVVRLMYQFPVYVQLWNPHLANAPGTLAASRRGRRFRNEPF